MTETINDDKRTVATDALATLGTIIGPDEKRDAIHLAVEPVTAGEFLRPGERITVRAGTAYHARTEAEGLGIVDPFLNHPVAAGERFWFVMLPRMVHSLRHVWTHPAFPYEVGAPAPMPVGAVERSKAWIKGYAERIGVHYNDLVDGAKDFIEGGEYLVRGGTLEGETTDPEFWTHYESLTDLAESRRVALVAALDERDALRRELIDNGFTKVDGAPRWRPPLNEAASANWRKLIAAEKLHDELSIGLKRLQAIIERERTAVAAGVEKLNSAIASRMWLKDGRGSFEYDDEKYQQEFGDAVDELLAAMKPLEAIAGDLSDCPRTRAEVVAARAGQANDDHTSSLIERIRRIARDLGWAIGVHGSLKRDIDLIAVPWTDTASSFYDLNCAIADRCDLWRGGMGNKPHGRIACIFIEPGARLIPGTENFEPPQIDLSFVDPRPAALPAVAP